MDVVAILLVGVGGQGTILASKILSDGLIRAGYDLKMSEVHGMAQRGGSVTTLIRYGEKVYSPVVETVDYLVAFERMEALRFAGALRKGGKAIINDYALPSAPILQGKAAYPEGILERLRRRHDLIVLDAARIAEGLGNLRVANTVLVGALLGCLPVSGVDWDLVISDNVKPAYVSLNQAALKAGIAAAAQMATVAGMTATADTAAIIGV